VAGLVAASMSVRAEGSQTPVLSVT
jgi:hypothetical protein